jgi:hypothetical protein
VAAKLKDELGVESKSIPFTLDHTVYGPPSIAVERDIDVLLFARPGQDRRCFELISEGLIKLKAKRPELKVALFGDDQYEDFGIEFTSFGSIADTHELARLYHRAKIGICFSPTNPSQLGYEMLACGVNLIDVRIKFSDLNFGGDEFVSYCDGSPESLVAVCESLANDEAESDRRRQLGYAFAKSMPDDSDLGAAFASAAGITAVRKGRGRVAVFEHESQRAFTELPLQRAASL